MQSIMLNIAGFFVEISNRLEHFDLPLNYRPFVAEQPSGASQAVHGDVLLRMDVSGDTVDKTGAEMIGSFEDLGYRQDVYRRQGGGYIFDIFGYDGSLAATMESAPRFSENRVCLCEADRPAMEFGFNNTLMIAFAFSSAHHDTLMMHSSVVAKNGEAYMFLGKSGTGKSTHSSLWLRHLEGYHLLNDDNPVLRIVDGEVRVYGSPWSGKTPCYRQEQARVGALVMLEQKPYNRISRENVVVALSSMLCSCSVMIWDKESYDAIMRTIEQVIGLRGVWHLECLPDEDAARLSHDSIANG